MSDETLCRIIEKIFELSTNIRYVALKCEHLVQTSQRDSFPNASSHESDHYEELFVNPILLALAKARGDLDCGGAQFVIVGYGNFLQLVIALTSGHVSVCFAKESEPIRYVDPILAICDEVS